MTALRDLLAVLLTLAAACALGLWAPARWTQDTLVDAQGFEAVARPLADDPRFQQQVADSAVDGVLDQVHLPRALRGALEPELRTQTSKLAGTPAFAAIWGTATRDLHAALLDPRGGRVQADLRPYVRELTDPVGRALGVTIDVPDSDRLRLDLLVIPPSPWAARVTAFGDAGRWLGWVGIGSAMLALVVARHRGVIAALLGVCVLVAGGMLLLASRSVGALVPDAVDGAPVLGPLVQAFERDLASQMVTPSTGLLAAGGLTLVVALVAIGVQRSRRRPA